MHQFSIRHACKSNNRFCRQSGGNLEIVSEDDPHAQRQLKAGERVLKKVRQEKNSLQDANIQLGVELKDVRAQLADSVKENKRLQRGIFSKCLNELFIEFGEETG